MHEGFRYYSYELQRYASEDPIGFAGGDVNFYVRVQNRPTMFIDPLGFIKWKQTLKGAGYVAGGIVGIILSGTVEIGSGGLATFFAVSGTIGSSTLLSMGVIDMMTGIADKEIKMLTPHPVSIGTYICTKNLDKAEEYQLYYDVFTGTTRTFDLLISNPSKIEETKHIIDIILLQYGAINNATSANKKSSR